MATVNSLSGGKTSSYLAAHYPADIDIFALVCIDCHNAGNYKIDPKLRQMANDRLQITSAHHGEFISTAEDPIILKTMFELEQHIGREITWVRGMSFEKMMDYKQAVPNIAKRFCSGILKITPIFEYLFIRDLLPCSMRIGYRYDEAHRINDFTTIYEFAYQCDLFGQFEGCNRWMDFEWRSGEFPLVDDRIIHPHVKGYWNHHTNVPFAEDSNCQICFWKEEQQLRKNFDNNPEIMAWGGVQEVIRGYRFKDKHTLFQIARMGIQMDFNFGTGSGCQAGFCTD